MKHVHVISNTAPVKAESLLVIQQKVEIFTAFAEAIGTLAESISAWMGLADGE